MNSAMANLILSKVREKQANSGHNPTGERKPWGREADYNPVQSLVDLVRTGLTGPSPANTAPAAGTIFKKGPSESRPYKLPETIASIGSSIANAPYDLTKFLGNRISQSFTPTSDAQIANAMAEQRNASISGAAQESDFKRMLLLGLGAGAVGGGLYGLHRAFSRPNVPKKDEDEEIALQYPVARSKTASGGILESLLGAPKGPSVVDNPLFIPGAILGTGAAGYLGFKGATGLARMIEANAKKEEMRKAKQQFHDAMIASYEKPLEHDPHHQSEKLAADNPMVKLSRMLDAIYDATFEKKGNNGLSQSLTRGGAIPTFFDYVTPTAITIGGLGALAAGSMAYDATRKHSKAEALKKALRDRARMKYEQAPPEMFISPEAIDVSALKNQRSGVV